VLAKVIKEAKMPREDPGIEWHSRRMWKSIARFVDKDHDGRFSEKEIEALGKAGNDIKYRTPDELLATMKEDEQKAIQAGTWTLEKSTTSRMKSLVFEYRSRLDDAIKGVHQQLDIDKNKSLDEKEATQLLVVIEIDDLGFKALDTNKDGALSEKEISTVLKTKLDLDFKKTP